MVRFVHGVENRVGFRKIFKKFFEGKSGGSIDDEEQKAEQAQEGAEQTQNTEQRQNNEQGDKK